MIEQLGDVVVGFGTAVIDAVKAIPGIIGIDLVGEEEEDDTTALQSSIEAGFEESSGGHGAIAALAFMVFILLYTPCMAAVGAIKGEIGSRWMWTSIIGQTLLAWVMAVAVFQIGVRVFG